MTSFISDTSLTPNLPTIEQHIYAERHLFTVITQNIYTIVEIDKNVAAYVCYFHNDPEMYYPPQIQQLSAVGLMPTHCWPALAQHQPHINWLLKIFRNLRNETEDVMLMCCSHTHAITFCISI